MPRPQASRPQVSRPQATHLVVGCRRLASCPRRRLGGPSTATLRGGRIGTRPPRATPPGSTLGIHPKPTRLPTCLPTYRHRSSSSWSPLVRGQRPSRIGRRVPRRKGRGQAWGGPRRVFARALARGLRPAASPLFRPRARRRRATTLRCRPSASPPRGASRRASTPGAPRARTGAASNGSMKRPVRRHQGGRPRRASRPPARR
mmetsp:Transcript_49444/g.112216  ORF Transcript_49444/g.112216 Transcript_49444/m.112216 type:complete len:203 (+) Transcript_49444:218-826(+)